MVKRRNVITPLLSLLALLLLIACKRNDTHKDFVLKGQLLDNCSGQPATNVSLELWQNLIKGSTALDPDKPAYLIATVSTDSNGNFEFRKEFDTKNSSNFPRDGSIRLASVGTSFATGWMEIESGKLELDLGNLFNNMEKTMPFVFMSTENFEAGDKVIISKPHDLSSFDTLSVTASGNAFITNRLAHFTTKNFIFNSPMLQENFSGIVNVAWDFKNKPDQNKLLQISTGTCGSQDTVYLKWW